MRLFTGDRDRAVQSFVLKLLNNNCPDLRDRLDGPRLEGRVNLTLVALVVPSEDKKPLVRQAFTAVTKEFSSRGVALALDEALGLNEAFLGFSYGGGVQWLRAKAKQLSPMGGGFYQLGFRLVEQLAAGDYPELAKLGF
ncbi:MAG: hypothetical protein ABSG86_28380 [Thermoguttaceae bacterium]|jgi:hypothetical protein